MERSLPTPPREEHRSHSSRKHSSTKSTKNVHRGSKRASTHSHSHSHSHSPSSPYDGHATADGRHKRVWKACERCRVKKTKCDGEFPCKRCKDDGLVCTAGTRKKTEYKQIPKGYAEVLENTQFALIATVHKLYAMVRSNQPWELGEPDLNDRGQPVIHNIAAKLGCIRPNADLDLPPHSVFPEDEAGLAELAAQLQHAESMAGGADGGGGGGGYDSDEHSDELDTDYRRAVFGGGSTVASLSPQSLTYTDFDVGCSTPSDGFMPASPALATSFPATWAGQQQYLPTTTPSTGTGYTMNVDLLNQGLLESSFGTLKPHVHGHPEVMMGMGDPMMYSGYGAETLRM